MLPNFLVIGAYKSGTTSLHQYLAQHPDIFVPRVKEPSYFAFAAGERRDDSLVFQKSIKTRSEYESLFDGATSHKAIGEVSPEYMTSPTAAQSIMRILPNARLIAILRDPVERAYSDFLMYRRDGREEMSDFASALEMQAKRSSRNDPTGNYISTGFYGEQLTRYYDIFPANQIKVFLLEELETDGPQTLSKLFEFLGVDPMFVPDNLTIYNRSGITPNYLVTKLFQYRKVLAPLARKFVPAHLQANIRKKLEGSLRKPPLGPEIRQTLRTIYKDDVRLLEQLTGKSCRHWLE